MVQACIISAGQKMAECLKVQCSIAPGIFLFAERANCIGEESATSGFDGSLTAAKS